MKKSKLFLLALLIGGISLTGCSTSKNNISQSTKNNLIEVYQKWIVEDYAIQTNLLKNYKDLKEYGTSPQELQKIREKTLLYYNNIQLWQNRIKEFNNTRK